MHNDHPQGTHSLDSAWRWLGQQSGLPERDQSYADPETLDKETYPREPNPAAKRIHWIGHWKRVDEVFGCRRNGNGSLQIEPEREHFMDTAVTRAC